MTYLNGCVNDNIVCRYLLNTTRPVLIAISVIVSPLWFLAMNWFLPNSAGGRSFRPQLNRAADFRLPFMPRIMASFRLEKISATDNLRGLFQPRWFCDFPLDVPQTWDTWNFDPSRALWRRWLGGSGEFQNCVGLGIKGQQWCWWCLLLSQGCSEHCHGVECKGVW